ncbi:MAG: carboxypeptidase regulatory-like domain-containing protein, partial [Acidobacteriaceae bacterium]
VVLRLGKGADRTAVTGLDGGFLFSAVPAGSWTLQVHARGFRDQQRTITLKPGQQISVTIHLEIEIARQHISISSEDLDSSPDRSLGAMILRGPDLNSLPTSPRDLQRLLSIMAGSDLGAQFYIDGYTADHLPPKDSIQEIRLNQDPFSAQYDTAGNDRIEIITKPGGNHLHGNLALLGDYSPLNSRNPFVATQPGYASFFAQGDVSGPLTKASSWSLTFEQENIGAQSFIHAITSSTAPAFTQTIESPENGTELTPRIDFKWGGKHTLSFRYDLDHENQDDVLQSQLSLPAQAIDTRHTEHTFQFSDSQTYGLKLINDTRFQYIHLYTGSLSRNAATSILVQGAFNAGGNNLGQTRDFQNRYELQDHVSLLRGNHLLLFGGRIRDTQDNNSSTGGFNGQFVFPSIQAWEITQQGIANSLTPAEIRAQGGGASQFSLTAGTPQIRVNVGDLGLYFEDQWKLGSSMTLTPGLRYEAQTGIPDHADFAPRLTYGWSIGKAAKPAIVLRAGAGLFYQRFTSDLVLNADRQNGLLDQQYIVQNPDFYPNSPTPDELGSAALPTIYRVSPTLQAPYTLQATVGIEKQFSRSFFVHADYTYFRGIHLLLTRNINAPLPGTYNPDDPNSGTRPLGTLQNIYEYQSAGRSRRHELYVNFRYNTKPAIFYGYYVLSKRLADTAGAASFPSNQYDLQADYGRASNDIRDRMYLGGIIHAPLRFDFNPFFIVESAAPFNITTGQDLNGDSQFNDRPAFATDLTRPSVVRTQWGNFDTDPISGQQIIPINYASGPSFLMLNLLASRNIGLGPKLPAAPGQEAARRYQMSLGIEAQNVFNNVNGGMPVGVLSSPLFGHSTSLSANQFTSAQSNRIVYLHMTFSF